MENRTRKRQGNPKNGTSDNLPLMKAFAQAWAPSELRRSIGHQNEVKANFIRDFNVKIQTRFEKYPSNFPSGFLEENLFFD